MSNKISLTGFTLVEILLALAILGVGLVAILSVFVVGTNSIRRTVAMTEASFLGQMVMEDYKRQAKSDPGNFTPFDYTGYYDGYQVDTDGPTQEGKVYRFDVRIKKNGQDNALVTLTTYATKYEP